MLWADQRMLAEMMDCLDRRTQSCLNVGRLLRTPSNNVETKEVQQSRDDRKRVKGKKIKEKKYKFYRTIDWMLQSSRDDQKRVKGKR